MSTAIGRLAEQAAATALCASGYSILGQNWRTRWCEIDIVASKSSALYFVEVKYRGRTNWGTGFDYITKRKLQQMHFAAEFWLATHKADSPYCLAAMELTGDPPRVTGWVAPIE